MYSDQELLRRYVRDGSEPAFTELVQRHMNLVYFSALRRVGRNAHAADDVTQRVFTDLARKAETLLDRPNLAGWLYTGTRFAAAEVVRSEQRRRTHEQEAHAMTELDSPVSPPPQPLEPMLDEIVDLLPEQDREVVLLNVIEGLSFAEVGARLELNPDTARMRVNRALERLRDKLAKRGITSSAAALTSALSAQTLGTSLPSASLIAGQAIRAAAAAPIGTAVGLGSLLQLLKGSALIPWAGAAGTIATAALIWFARPTASTPAVPRPAPAPARALANAPAESPGSTQEMLVTETAPPAGAFAGPMVPTFATLPDAAKSVLKTLWTHQEDFGDPPAGQKWAFVVGAAAPNYSDFADGSEALATAGLARIGPGGGVFITQSGLEFGRIHRAEIHASSEVFNIRPEPPSTAFTSLPENERNILKTLWMHEEHYAPVPGVSWAFGIAEGLDGYAAFAEGRSGLLARGWIRQIPNRPGVYLTLAGRIYGEAHTVEIDDAPLVYKKYGPNE